MRRLRSTKQLRELTRETSVSLSDLIQPIFLVPGTGIKREVKSLPGQYQLSADKALEQAKILQDLGVKSVLLFAIPEFKDEEGSSAWQSDGLVQRTVSALKEQAPELVIVTDLCFCEYTSHGHCGILKDGDVDNDATLEIIAKQTISHAQAGADMIAPSGMIDGMVGAMRHALDESGFQNLPIMSYSAKFASSCYGPFREAADCAPGEADRKSYQMDPANINEALRETALDIEEGADIVMVKPALLYLDVIRAVKERFEYPTACYNVSGEYAMIKAAAQNGWIDGEKIMLETLLSFKRAGADIIISYFTEEVARLAQRGPLPLG